MLLVFVPGCARPASSESPSHASPHPDAEETSGEGQFSTPRDYSQAVDRLRECRDEISNAVATGDLERAHRPLDKVDWLLNRLPEIARASAVPRRSWEQVVEAGDDLGESLGEIHAEIDAGRKPSFSDRSAAIDDALTRLKEVVAAPVMRDETSQDRIER